MLKNPDIAVKLKMLVHDYITRVVKQRYTKTKLLQFIDEISIYLHDKIVYQIVLRINNNFLSQYRRISGDKTATTHIIMNRISPTKINDELINKSKINDLILVYNTRSQVVEVLPSTPDVWEAAKTMTEGSSVF